MAAWPAFISLAKRWPNVPTNCVHTYGVVGSFSMLKQILRNSVKSMQSSPLMSPVAKRPWTQEEDNPWDWKWAISSDLDSTPSESRSSLLNCCKMRASARDCVDDLFLDLLRWRGILTRLTSILAACIIAAAARVCGKRKKAKKLVNLTPQRSSSCC